MKKVIIDTCVWVAYFHKEDSQHEKAQKFFDKFSGVVVFPEEIIIELASVLQRVVNKNFASEVVQNFLKDDALEILSKNSEDFRNLMQFFCASDQDKLSPVDHLLLYLSDDYEIITFDSSLEKVL